MTSLDRNLLAGGAGEEPEEADVEGPGLPGPGPGDRHSLLGGGEGDQLIVVGTSAQGRRPGQESRRGVLEQGEDKTLKNRCLLISILHLMFISYAHLEHGHQVADCPHQLHEVKPPGGEDSVEVVQLHQEEPEPGGDHEGGEAGAHFSMTLLLNTEAAVLQALRQPPRPAALTPGQQRHTISTSETSIYWGLFNHFKISAICKYQAGRYRASDVINSQPVMSSPSQEVRLKTENKF